MTEARAARRGLPALGPARRHGARPPAVAALCALLLVQGAIAAGEAPDPDLSTDQLRRLGPVWLGPYVHLRDVGYDDNVFLDPGDGQGDYTATAVPGIRGLLRTGHRGGVAFGQEFAYVAFRDNSQLNHLNSDSRVRGILLAGPAVVSLEERFRSDRERPINEIDDRVRRDLNGLTAAIRVPVTGRLGGSAALRSGAIRYVSGRGVEDIQERLDRDQTSLTLVGEMKVRSRTTAFVETTLEEVDFAGRTERRDTSSVAVLPGLRIEGSAPVRGEVKAGFVSLDAPGRPLVPGDPASPAPRDYRGFTGEGAVAVRMGHASRLKLEGGRALPFSITTNNLYAVETSWAAACERFFSRRLSAEVRYGRTLWDYPERIPDSRGVLERREDRLWTWEMRVSYRLDEQLALTGSVQHQRRDSTDDDLDRDRNLFIVGTTVLL